ncbi:amyloid-beta A4 precursor protein-binding family A member 2 isoform X2 [Eleginops maclovinus]|uniref:amyloid-beta A4 precursor protein-binding family A member 2 isoform X2 n=1 Tax=Eleginops maclovinus TaxID=56733 RepID=UPI003080C37C
MVHGKRPGTITKILAPSPPPCSGPGVTEQRQEEQRGLVKEASEKSQCTLKDENKDQLTPPVPASHFYLSCDPSPEDMEDTCSEYDNVGSDVEQDYDEVLRLNREGVVDARFYKQYSPEDGGYIKHAVGDNINESSSAVDQFTPRPGHGIEICEGSQSDTKPHKTGHGFRSHCAPTAVDEAEREVKKCQENRFFFSDGDEIEEVLDGAKFIEDLEEEENTDQRKTSVYQDKENERVRKGGDERRREDDTRVARNRNIPMVSRKCEESHMVSKERERQSKGRGRRVASEDMEPIVTGIKGCTTNSSEQRPKTLSKDSKKAVVRTKARSGSSRQHPPPPPRHAHALPPADPHKAPPRRETPPVPRPSPSSANSQESEPRVIKPSLAPHQTPEPQREPLEDRQRRPEKPQQGEKPSTAVLPEDVPEQPRRPQTPEPLPAEDSNTPKNTQEAASFPSFEDGPCEPEDLIDGIIFAANYLGCTQVLSDKNPSKSVRMSQAHEAVSRIKSQDEDSQMMTEVDLFISTKAVKVLNADTQETMMDSALRTISYIADIGSIVVLMARRRLSQASSEDFSESPDSPGEGKSQYRMICYVFESEDAQLIAQSIGQAFSVAYREFLRANGINPTDLSQKQYSDIINSQEMYHDDLVHFSNSDNCKELYVEKQKGESIGVVIVESGWGSILPTVILASMLNSGPAARSGKLSVGDQIMSINDTSLVGLPLATCQGIIKGLKNQVKVKLSIVSCPPVTTVLIKRPDLKFQLGFSVQNGIICSLMRGGIAERGGVRVGHRIIEINGQSVVAMAHEKIVQTLSVSVGEINMKTMPAVMFRLLTGQETPLYI